MTDIDEWPNIGAHDAPAAANVVATPFYRRRAKREKAGPMPFTMQLGICCRPASLVAKAAIDADQDPPGLCLHWNGKARYGKRHVSKLQARKSLTP